MRDRQGLVSEFHWDADSFYISFIDDIEKYRIGVRIQDRFADAAACKAVTVGQKLEMKVGDGHEVATSMPVSVKVGNRELLVVSQNNL